MPNMLVLDDEESALAARLFEEVIALHDITTMIVFGATPEARRASALADQLAVRGLMDGETSFRRVIWVHDGDALSRATRLSDLFAAIRAEARGELPLAVVLDSSDRVRGALHSGTPFDAAVLELLFLKGDAS